MNWHHTRLIIRKRAIAYVGALVFMLFASTPTVHAEPTSVRCAEEYDKQPYFVTYELQTNHFVLESPVGNFLRGEIVFASENRLEFSLSATSGRHILLYFDRKNQVMVWPGLPAGEFGRFTLQHACASVADRTVLATARRPGSLNTPDLDHKRKAADAFSLRCVGNTQDYFVTMDRSTGAVLLELEGGRPLDGEIKSIDGPRISFTVRFYSVEQYDLVWDEQSRALTWIGVPNDVTRPTKTQECTVTNVRSIMEFYGRLMP